jgi:hypothetical protein
MSRSSRPPKPPAPAQATGPGPLPLPAKITVLCGARAPIHTLLLQSVCLRAARGESLALIVGDNRLDAYHLARLIRAQGLDPDEVLQRVALSRPFTCYQLHHSILTFDTSPQRGWSALYVMGLLELFYDQDIKLPEAERLVHSTLAGLKRIAANGLPILITIAVTPSASGMPYVAPPKLRGREHFVELVTRAADVYWQPSPVALEQLAARQLQFIGMI